MTTTPSRPLAEVVRPLLVASTGEELPGRASRRGAHPRRRARKGADDAERGALSSADWRRPGSGARCARSTSSC